MKIKKISFKNINNLKGEHSISFDSLPLSKAGIFAITGPTGSGKSTILDVITLALFNRIPRFKRALTKGEIEGAGSVLTHHCKSAAASIEYEIKGNTYTSSWSISVNRNNRLNNYEMFIYDQLGKPFDLGLKDVPKKNEELIGLKYDQFVKSIILSQGEFAKFLKADKNERGQLLEDITGTSIYRKIGIQVSEQYKRVRAAVEQEQIILEDFKTLNDEERANLLKSIEENQKIKLKFDEELEHNNLLKQTKIQLISILKEITQKKREALQLEEKQKAFVQQLEKLDLHQKLSPMQGDLALYEQAQEEIKITKANIESIEKRQKEYEEKHQFIIQKMSDLTGKDVDSNNFRATMSVFEREIIDLDLTLKNIKIKGGEERERVNNKKQHLSFIIEDKIAPSEAIKILETKAKQLDTTIAKANLSRDTNVKKVVAQYKEDQSEFAQLAAIKQGYNQLDKLQEDLDTTKEALKSQRQKIITNTPLLETISQLVKSIEDNLVMLQEQKELIIKIASLEEHRRELVEGKPCPLCGSLEHPLTKHQMEVSPSEIDQKLNEIKQQHHKKKKEEDALKTTVAKCQTSIKLLDSRIQEIAPVHKKIEQEIALLTDQFEGKSDFNKQNIEHSISQLKATNTLVGDAIEALNSVNLVQDLIKDYSNIELIHKTYIKKDKERKEKYQGADISNDCNLLHDNFTTCSNNINIQIAALKTEKEKLRNTTKNINDIQKKLLPKIKSLGFDSLEEVVSHLLDEQLVSSLNNRKEELKQQETANQSALKDLIIQKNKYQKLDNNPNLEFSVLEKHISSIEQDKELLLRTTGEKEAQLKRDEEDRAKIEKKKKGLELLKKDLSKWTMMHKMIGDVTGNKFANFAQGLTLQNLLVHANHRLKNLTDRYLLDKPSNDGALMVIDQYQGNIQRAVTTLSGGESFVISLALALSLSDMASKNVVIESLFIDEGFGTLDPETLDIAMNTLERLQSESQKVVAVISHVEALKERINVQIKLKKNAQGYSKIVIE